MASLPRIRSTILILSITAPLLLPSIASAHQFTVGGPLLWTVPSGQDSEAYNIWASDNRFHVGDVLYFEYQRDSVLVVTRDYYTQCNISNPIMVFRDGQTKFRFDRYGFYYFISGEPGHCTAGQRMIVRVMVQADPDSVSPWTAPASSPGAYAPGPYHYQPTLSPARSPTSSVQPRYSAAVKLSVGFSLSGLFLAILVGFI